MILARYTLGRSFSVTAKARALVTTGIYARIRNPIYVSSSVFVAGIFLIVRQPRLWLVLAAIIVMQIVRARNEARVLEAGFGDAYREYRRHTWLRTAPPSLSVRRGSTTSPESFAEDSFGKGASSLVPQAAK